MAVSRNASPSPRSNFGEGYFQTTATNFGPIATTRPPFCVILRADSEKHIPDIELIKNCKNAFKRKPKWFSKASFQKKLFNRFLQTITVQKINLQTAPSKKKYTHNNRASDVRRFWKLVIKIYA